MAAQKIFVVCPIGKEGSPERQQSDKLLKHVIQPVVEKLFPGSKPDDVIVRADKIGEPGKITTQILRELVSASCVIVDLSGTNPNVMYELGIRQALAKPLVLMAESGQALPFDLNDYRTIFYKLDLDHVEAAQSELKKHIEKALEGNLSALDQALFERGAPAPESAQDRKELLSILEVCGAISKEITETKEFMVQVGGVVLSLQDAMNAQIKAEQERKNTEFGLQIFSQVLQNPDSMDKALPFLQKMAELGNKQMLAQSSIESPQAQKPNRKK